MSDYQRFVSYIYEYQDSEKSKNCGFSRVEVRNHQCRLEVHMKLPVYPFTPVFQVFAFVPSGEQMLGLPLGKAGYHQGAVYGVFTIPDRNINGLPYGMNDLGGLYIQTDSGQFFATVWKEINVQPKLFVNFENTPQVQAASLEEDEPLSDDNVPEHPMTEPNAMENPPESSSGSAAAPPRDSENNIMQDSGRNIIETPGNTDTDHVIPGDIPNYNGLRTSGEQPDSSAPVDSWEKIQGTYPHIQPFFDDNIHQCVKLSLKDIPQLNQYGIPIGMNQFLIHGCQSYRHFLLGRSADSGNDEYVLAVPGIYDEKEQFLASMFGFPNFKPSRNNAIRPGQFGYWYRMLY